MALHFELVSPEKLVFSGEVTQVDLPGAEGDFGVLDGHAPLVTTLRPGIMTVVQVSGASQKIVVLGGFAEVSDKGLTVLADTADNLKDFDRATLAAQIAALEQQTAKMEGGNELDKLITRLDHFKEVDRHLTGTAAH